MEPTQHDSRGAGLPSPTPLARSRSSEELRAWLTLAALAAPALGAVGLTALLLAGALPVQDGIARALGALGFLSTGGLGFYATHAAARLRVFGRERARAEGRLRASEEAQARIAAQAADFGHEASRLEEARALAEAASSSKSEFLANMSHEIRTPMTAILGYADLMADPTASPAERAEAVQRIRKSGQHLLAILNDILDISKIEAGKMTVERIECHVPRIVAEALSLTRPRAIEKRLALEVVYEGAIPATIRSDPTRLRQILINLIGNAIKFTAHGGVRLVVAMAPSPVAGDSGGTPCASSGARVAFAISDSGIGMTPEQVAALFAPFTQADPSMARKFGGTGLGLTISRRLAEMLGGGISLCSAPGQGTTFTVEVETGALDGVEWVRPAHEVELARLDEPDGADGGPGRSGGRDASGAAPSLAGLRLLLADDARDNQRIISYHLRKAGAEVESADDGRFAVEKARRALADGRPFAVVLMDMQMPELDGYGATRLLRADGYVLPIVALTAHAMAGDREQCLAAGCDDYATKPIDPRRLIETIATWAAARPGVDTIGAALPHPGAKEPISSHGSAVP